MDFANRARRAPFVAPAFGDCSISMSARQRDARLMAVLRVRDIGSACRAVALRLPSVALRVSVQRGNGRRRLRRRFDSARQATGHRSRAAMSALFAMTGGIGWLIVADRR